MNRVFKLAGSLAGAVILAGIAGCASTSTASENASAREEGPADKDPFESVNRAVFEFNDTLDAYLLKPVSKAYDRAVPEPMQVGVDNFFSNLQEVPNTANNLMQGKWGAAGNSSGRFLLNSTIGLAGLVDVADAAGLQKTDGESFGQTLSVWGMEPGPYLVLPLLGSRTLTDTLGLPVDWATDPVRYLESDGARLALKSVEVVDDRAGLLRAEALISGDRYTFIREAYLQRRDYLVNDGVVEDDFGGDMEDFGDFEDFESSGDF